MFKTIRLIDTIAIWSGKILSWLVYPLVGGLTWEVISRYMFNAPTVWAYDLTYMLYGTIFMVGAAYTLYKQSHIRTDILYQKWSPRTKGLIDATLFLFFFFPGIFFFFILGWDYAAHSWSIREVSDASPWRPAIYPFKTVIPVSAFLLLIQGISEFLKSVYSARHGRPYES